MRNLMDTGATRLVGALLMGMALLMGTALALAACSSSTELGVDTSASPPPAPTATTPADPTATVVPATPTPTAGPLPTTTPVPTQDGTAAPTGPPPTTATPAPETPTPEPQASPEPQGSPTPEPSPTPVPPSPLFAQVCAADSIDTDGRVQDPDLNELSGLAFSARNPGILWAHNDSGDEPRVWALREDGQSAGILTIPDIDAVDWEDIAVGPGPTDEPYLYIADIGDNNSARETVTVYRMPEPVVNDTGVVRTERADVLTLRYPDGAADAETLLVDPRTGDLVIVTKRFNDEAGDILYTEAPAAGDATVTLTLAGRVEFSEFDVNLLASALDGGRVPTAGDVAPDGDVVLIRTYGTVLAFPRLSGQPLWAALFEQPCEAASSIELQGEAIAVTSGRYITIGEATEPAVNVFEFG